MANSDAALGQDKSKVSTSVPQRAGDARSDLPPFPRHIAIAGAILVSEQIRPG